MSEAVKHSVPAKMAFEITRGYTMKPHHPLLESTVVGIDVLNMIDATDSTLACGNIDGAMNDPRVLGDQLVRGQSSENKMEKKDQSITRQPIST